MIASVPPFIINGIRYAATGCLLLLQMMSQCSDLFLEIIFNKNSENIMEIYNKLRSSIRDELGNPKVKFNKDSVFISYVSTNALEIKSKN